jgi:hypothetical protein
MSGWMGILKDQRTRKLSLFLLMKSGVGNAGESNAQGAELTTTHLND